MIANYKIDQTRTFGSVLFLGCEPKAVFGEADRQEMTRDGRGKYVAQLAAEFRAFGRAQRELINVGVVGETDPCAGILPGTPVELVDFEIGVMEKRNRDGQVVGVQVWYRCAQIRPTSATGAERKPRTGPAAVEAVSS